jgi:hypothetical protein
MLAGAAKWTYVQYRGIGTCSKSSYPLFQYRDVPQLSRPSPITSGNWENELLSLKFAGHAKQDTDVDRQSGYAWRWKAKDHVAYNFQQCSISEQVEEENTVQQ